MTDILSLRNELFSLLYNIVAQPTTFIAVFTTVLLLLVTYMYIVSQEKESSGIRNENVISEKRETETSHEPVTDEDLKNILLDNEDLTLLDLSNSREVKNYVKKMRSPRYKAPVLTEPEKELEERTKQQQLASIFALMKKEEEKFGETSIGDLNEQMNLYN